MALLCPSNYLEIIPLCLSLSTIIDNDIKFLDEYTGIRSCLCLLEIIYLPDQGPEKLLFSGTQECLFTELPDGTNTVGLKLASPFYVGASCLLVPTEKNHGPPLTLANQYQVRFRFAIPDKERGSPISLHQLFGLDPLLWARGCCPLAKIASGIYRIRMEFTVGEDKGLDSIQKWQMIPWDLRIRCWWTDRALSDVDILHAEDPSNLFRSNTSSPPLPPRECLRINTSISSGKLKQPPHTATSSVPQAQLSGCKGRELRRSKRLNKPEVQKRISS